MAVKSLAEVLELVQETARLRDLIIAFCTGDFTTTRASISAAINAGDDQPEDIEQQEALDACVTAAERFLGAADNLFFLNHKTLGRYSGSLNLNDANTNMQAFHDKLTTDSQSVESRGLTKFSSFTANGSNYGNGRFTVLNTDPQGVTIDISHIETMTMRCIKEPNDGNGTGTSQFLIEGAAAADEDYVAGGSSGGQGFEYDFTGKRTDFATNAKKVQEGGFINAVGGSTAQGNLITNGDFEAALGTGSTKISGFTITSGEANVTVETAQPDLMIGDQSLKLSGNAVLYHPLTNVTGLRAYSIHDFVRVDAAATAGTITIKVKDDSTTHATVTIDTTTLTDDTDTDTAPTNFILPYNYGENLRLEIEMASFAGSGAAYLDEVSLSEMSHFDGRNIAIHEGLLKPRKTDFVTGATTSTDGGKLEKSFAEVMGARGVRGWVRHEAVATSWPDY